MTLNEFKQLIREEAIKAIKSINEEAPLVNPKPVNLKDNSKQEVLGDPLEDVKLNTMIGKASADKNIVKAVGVKPGSKNGGNCPTTGQAKPYFTKKTEAPKNNFGAKQK